MMRDERVIREIAWSGHLHLSLGHVRACPSATITGPLRLILNFKLNADFPSQETTSEQLPTSKYLGKYHTYLSTTSLTLLFNAHDRWLCLHQRRSSEEGEAG